MAMTDPRPASATRIRRALGVLAALTTLAILSPAVAGAATASLTFTGTGEEPYIVPAGVTSVSVTLVGAPGGTGNNEYPQHDAPGGVAGTAQATIAVSPGQVLFAEVGSAGAPGLGVTPGAGGSNGGGAGGYNAPGGGGGGATDVRLCSVTAGNPLSPVGCTPSGGLGSRLLVAGRRRGRGRLGLGGEHRLRRRRRRARLRRLGRGRRHQHVGGHGRAAGHGQRRRRRGAELGLHAGQPRRARGGRRRRQPGGRVGLRRRWRRWRRPVRRRRRRQRRLPGRRTSASAAAAEAAAAERPACRPE